MSDVYYHYTDPDSARKIKDSGRIKASGLDGKDAVFGKGAYLTKIPPSAPKAKIAENNFDDSRRFVQDKLNQRKADAVVAVKIPKGDPKLHKESAGKRDVYRYDGDLDLTDKQHAIGNIRRK